MDDGEGTGKVHSEELDGDVWGHALTLVFLARACDAI